MQVSYNWLKELLDFNLTANEVIDLIQIYGIEVEHIIDFKEKYRNFYIGRILERELLPKSDHLSVLKVQVASEIYTIICGAPNCDANQNVVVALPGAVIPTNELVIVRRKIRGVESNGMVCSKQELGISDDHSGIWILDDNASIGTPFAEYFNSNDVILEIGITPNRADWLSHFGVAREIAAVKGLKLIKPEIQLKEAGEDIEENCEVIIEAPEKCHQYVARIVRNVKVQDSPQWLKNKLLSLGLRPINVVVDVANFVMLECGQPLHCFDLSCVENNTIVVKTAQENSKFTTLDSKERILDGEMLMICDKAKAVAIAGVMGGENSEIKESTTDVLIESALFLPSSIRRTSKKLGISSDASYRFERGIDYDSVVWAANRTAQLLEELAGGVCDKGMINNNPIKHTPHHCSIRWKRTCDVIGLEISQEHIVDMLERLGFKLISKNGASGTFAVPSFRVDIEQEIDLIEEVVRLYNYDNLVPDYSSKIDFSTISGLKNLAAPELRSKLKNFFIYSGYNEILTQNMIAPSVANLFVKVEGEIVQIANPLREELSIMRPSIIPSVLQVIDNNLKNGNNSLRLFELGKSFLKVDENKRTILPGFFEFEQLVVAITGKKNPKQWAVQSQDVDFYDIKGIIESMFEFLKFKNYSFKNLNEKDSIFSNNSLQILVENEPVGILGDIPKNILKKFDVDINVFIVCIDLEKIYASCKKEMKYTKVSQYPAMTRDLCFILNDKIMSEEIIEEINKINIAILKEITIFDIYKGKNIEQGKKSIAFSLTFQSEERTLTDEEVDSIVKNIIHSIENKFNAQLRTF